MITCKTCGTQSPDGTRTCPKCGVLFLRQFQAEADEKRARTGKITRAIGWVVGLIILAVVGPKLYHVGATAYYKHHLQSITEGVTRRCDGPVTETMGVAEKAKIEQCLNEDSELTIARKAYADVTKDDPK